jgi:photosystem II stability/assembly factor-like uncharacterized protein
VYTEPSALSKYYLRKKSLKLLCVAVSLVLALPVCAAQVWTTVDITDSSEPDKSIGVMAYDKTTNQLFVGGRRTSVGLRSSRDEGQTWQVVTTEVPIGIVIDSAESSRIYLALADGRVLRTEDGGHTWGSAFLSRSGVTGIEIDRNDHRTIYAINGDGFWKSVDSGRTWKQPSGGRTLLQSVISGPQLGHLVAYGYDRNYLLDSTDGGKSWAPVFPKQSWGTRGMTVFDPTDSGWLYTTFSARGFYFSQDGGVTWKESSPGALPVPPDPLDHGYIVVDSARPSHIILCRAGIFESQDSGASWRDITGNMPKVTGTILLVNHKLYAASWGLKVTTLN